MNRILASINNYNYRDGVFTSVFAKRIQQDLHHWARQLMWDKYRYDKYETYNAVYWYFYKAINNPPASEKIVHMMRTAGYGVDQMWAFIT